MDYLSEDQGSGCSIHRKLNGILSAKALPILCGIVGRVDLSSKERSINIWIIRCRCTVRRSCLGSRDHHCRCHRTVFVVSVESYHESPCSISAAITLWLFICHSVLIFTTSYDALKIGILRLRELVFSFFSALF